MKGCRKANVSCMSVRQCSDANLEPARVARARFKALHAKLATLALGGQNIAHIYDNFHSLFLSEKCAD